MNMDRCPWDRAKATHGTAIRRAAGGNMPTIITRVNGRPVRTKRACMLILLITAVQISDLRLEARMWQRAKGWEVE